MKDTRHLQNSAECTRGPATTGRRGTSADLPTPRYAEAGGLALALLPQFVTFQGPRFEDFGGKVLSECFYCIYLARAVY